MFERLIVHHLRILTFIFFAMLCKRVLYIIVLEILTGTSYLGVAVYSMPLISCVFWAFMWVHIILPQLYDILHLAQARFHDDDE